MPNRRKQHSDCKTKILCQCIHPNLILFEVFVPHEIVNLIFLIFSPYQLLCCELSFQYQLTTFSLSWWFFMPLVVQLVLINCASFLLLMLQFIWYARSVVLFFIYYLWITIPQQVLLLLLLFFDDALYVWMPLVILRINSWTLVSSSSLKIAYFVFETVNCFCRQFHAGNCSIYC